MRIRLEVLINGESRCIAGVEKKGDLYATVCSRYIDPRRRTPLDKLFPDHANERKELRVHWESADGERGGAWLREDLEPGDEVTIRVLGRGRSDPSGPLSLLDPDDGPEIPF